MDSLGSLPSSDNPEARMRPTSWHISHIQNKEFIGKKLRWAIQKIIDEFRALGPSAFDCCDEDGIIEKIL